MARKVTRSGLPWEVDLDLVQGLLLGPVWLRIVGVSLEKIR